jgi:uncharacterized protein (DUF1778 family)
MASNTDTVTIQLTLSKSQQQTLEEQAVAQGLTLSDYLLQIALNATATDEVPLIAEQIAFSQRDWQILTDAIAAPPKPNTALKSAFAEYQAEFPQS